MAQSEISLFAEQLDELCGRSMSPRTGLCRHSGLSSRSNSSIVRGRRSRDAPQTRRKNRWRRSPEKRAAWMEAVSSPTAGACEAALISCNSFNSYRLATVIPPEPGRGTWEGDDLQDGPAASRSLRRLPPGSRRRNIVGAEVSTRPLLSTAELVALLNARTSGNVASLASREGDRGFCVADSGAPERRSFSSSLHKASCGQDLAFAAEARNLEMRGDSCTDVRASKGEAMAGSDLEYPFSPQTPISAALATGILTEAAAAAAKEGAEAVQLARDALGGAVFRQAVAEAKAEEEQRHLLRLLAQQAEEQAAVARELESLRNSQKALAHQQQELQLKQDLLQRQGAASLYAQLQREREILEVQHAKLQGFTELQLKKATAAQAPETGTGPQLLCTQKQKLPSPLASPPSSPVYSSPVSRASSPVGGGDPATATTQGAATTRLPSSPVLSSAGKPDPAPALKFSGAPRFLSPDAAQQPDPAFVDAHKPPPPMAPITRVSPQPARPSDALAAGASPVRGALLAAEKERLICGAPTEKGVTSLASSPPDAPRVSYPGQPPCTAVQRTCQRAGQVRRVASPARSPSDVAGSIRSSSRAPGRLCASVCCGAVPSTVSSPRGPKEFVAAFPATLPISSTVRSSSVPVVSSVALGDAHSASQHGTLPDARPLQVSAVWACEGGRVVGNQQAASTKATTVLSSAAAPVRRVYYRAARPASCGARTSIRVVGGSSVPAPSAGQPVAYVAYPPLFPFAQPQWVHPLSVPSVASGPAWRVNSDSYVPVSSLPPARAATTGMTAVQLTAAASEFGEPESERRFSPLRDHGAPSLLRTDKRHDSHASEPRQPENSTTSGTEGWVKFESAKEPWELEAPTVSGRVLELRHQRQQLQQQRQALWRQHLQREEEEQARVKREEEDLAFVKREQRPHRRRRDKANRGERRTEPSVSGQEATARMTEKLDSRTATAGVQTVPLTATYAGDSRGVSLSGRAAPAKCHGRNDLASVEGALEDCRWPGQVGSVNEGAGDAQRQTRLEASPGNPSDVSAVTAAAAAAAAEAARTAARRAADGVQEAAAAILEPIQPIQERLVKLFSSRSPSRRETVRRYVHSPAPVAYYYPAVGMHPASGFQGGTPLYAWGVPRVVGAEATQ
ncbi:conserved hypothetical protein [Neospora caninum Liverpool]|uniref:Uncharacterized protein n=1 Tax=Neospora caninum (strain Liverpool) TaxID=572307 RepID=F0VFI4_NEOCL|nr:conserved hypothetical protein [Neospora caninum Liverpool]CBZ52478.1 conserved hypothetical protein [Neospora caninum Liverpool]CEL66455.1 TPA: hypothetical protein BN1204_022670 [Neospora caninum Liverpool]|eukprot:XP_003882510.1 conserved hypothetical protein [Neospora caninum Liverpool]